jgi:O-antigen ligase
LQDSPTPSFFTDFSPAQLVVIAVVGLLVLAIIWYFSFKVPTAVLLGLVLSAAIVQGFKPVGYISLALLSTVALAPAILTRSTRDHWSLWPKLITGVFVWQIISVLWAVRIGSVAHAAISTLVLLLAYLLARQVADTPGGIRLALTIAAPVILLQSLLTVVFRFSPVLESAFYSSTAALFLSEPDVELMASGIPQNVSDPDKAGGFLLNGNITSLLMAVVACIYIYEYLKSKKRLFAIVAAVCVVACVSTGSKTALVLLVALPLLAGFVVLVTRRKRLGLIAGGVVAALVVVTVSALAVTGFKQVFSALPTLGDRGALWTLAARAFADHPFLGLGYGGWSDYVSQFFYTVFPADRTFQIFPPHNFVIQAWADGGIVLALLALVAAVIPIVGAVRLLNAFRTRRPTSSDALSVAALFIAAVWVVAHGTLDTTSFFGENHTIAFVAVVVAFCTRDLQEALRNPNTSDVTDTSGLEADPHHTTPAAPEVGPARS